MYVYICILQENTWIFESNHAQNLKNILHILGSLYVGGKLYFIHVYVLYVNKLTLSIDKVTWMSARVLLLHTQLRSSKLIKYCLRVIYLPLSVYLYLYVCILYIIYIYSVHLYMYIGKVCHIYLCHMYACINTFFTTV